ncbi:DUF11 domain-containing protein [Labedella endophytica]|uniref:DUF11 domain-containing protein n=1 Tax=Labedella endophytica TaxID=1523160 RepID=A0A433JWQ6_9MICO|nr:DUF11 domain-containing protein [Labedella endophytica]RUR03428.1 DUF11 domain-containing protein [Labedella endophytica]
MGITGKPTHGSTRGRVSAWAGARRGRTDHRQRTGASTPLAGAMLGGERGRATALGLVLLLLAAILTSFTVLAQTSPAVAAPGTPGVPGDPIVLYTEDFENRAANSNTRLVDYTSDTGMSYSGSTFWTTRANCNGFIINRLSPRVAGDCNGPAGTGTNAGGAANYNHLTAVPYALGQLRGAANPSANAAASSYTAGSGTDNEVQFRTDSALTLPTANRFITFSVDAGAMNCFSTHPELRFYLVNDAGQEIPVSDSAIDPCTDPRTSVFNGLRRDGTTVAVSAGTFAADSSVLLQGSSLGIVMRNENGFGNGNDGAYDNIQVLDVTPQLDKSFSPRSVPLGGVSTLTFTVTNTSELAAKPGWSGTDVLESGLVVADPANTSTTCANGAVATSAGSDTIDLSGDLLAGQVSCTFSVDVTSTVPVTGGIPNRFENCASNFPDLVGLNPPACADLEFYGTPELEITKSSDATTDVRPGDTVTYSVTATNIGDDDFTVADPAIVIDDLSGVLDDGTYDGNATSTRGTDPVFDDPRLTWSGALAKGESVTIDYTVTIDGSGDGEVRNVAFGSDDLITPTPECDPPVDGTDPDTGLPCSVEEFDLPRLVIDKAADRTELPASGDQVTYTVTITNPSDVAYTTALPATAEDDLSDVLDDATLDESSIAASSGTATFADPTLTWSGSLAAGASATITYTVTYTGEGDHVLTNTACVPAGDVSSPDLPCDSVEIPGSGLSQWKSASPSSDPLVAGSTVAYTLFFENDGETAAAVDAVDDLTHVTDDADVTVDVSSPDGLTVTRTGDRIAISGSVPAGETHTVTYTVTIKADGERGDDIVANYLIDPDGIVPTDPTCEPTNEQEPDCTTNPVGSVEYSKSVETAATPITDGTELTYTLTVANTGQTVMDVSKTDDLTGVLDDADVTSAPIVAGSSTVTASPVVGGIITLGGTIGVGETATITYVVSVKPQAERGDNSAANFLVAPGEETPEVCEPGSDQCTVTPLPDIEPSKSVNPASGSSVSAGDELEYTLTFVNDGRAAGTVDYVDFLTDVLDDATVTGQPASSDPSVEAVLTGDELAVSGTIDAGATVTVTYRVTVNADGARGDNRLGNFLTDGTPPPPNPECVEGDPLCTVNLVGELHDWKSVEASETPVAAGTELTYTLHFENRGEGDVDVNRIDDLTHVLDDADVTAEPASDTLTVTRDGETISIAGSLEPGESATVTYTVTVKADGARGDDAAVNFLLLPGTPTPEPVCQPTDAEEPDCTTTPIGSYTAAKSVEASTDPIGPGTQLTYTLTFDNQSAAAVSIVETDDLTRVLDDAEMTTPPVSSDPALTVSPVMDGVTRITGTLAAGQTVTVTYVVTVNEESARGDNSADNFLVPGTPPPGEEYECEPGDPRCTETPLPSIEPSKSVDPAPGTPVKAGEVLTYTLSFENVGQAAGDVSYTDFLADVLDDAALTGQPVSSDPGVSVIVDGETIAVSGTIEAGATVTVTYQVTVKPDGERGDNRATNFVTDGTPPTPTEECEDGDPLCTTTLIGELHDWKTVEASETPVAAGTELTYTLHVENRGAGSIDVNRADFLTHVLDDADVTAEPTSDTLTVARDGETISITGSLGAGESATVVYTVTVKADGERGDSIAANFLIPVEPGEEIPPPPTDPVCQPTDTEEPDCTTTPIGQLTTGKSVEASSDPIVPGTTLTYTLTFDNQSAAAVTVDHDDDLSSVLDDADVTSIPESSDPVLTVSPIIDGSLSITGELAPGQTVTVTYVVTVKEEADRGDDVATNFLVKDGETPPEECVEGDPNCTSTPLPNVDAAKSVDPASGSSVRAGDVLTYTLTFTNDGNATGAVDYTDYLADIIDDATITGAPASSDAAVSAVVDGETITVAGSLAAGATVTVTYEVTVGADGERGDNHLGNFLVPREEIPPTECVEGSTLCTENPIGELHDWKTVEASETPVAAGTELTYTLHFENRGEGHVDVNRIDFLTHVLDDADVTAEPSSDTLTVTRDGETITITGSLEPGESSTVVYTVTVKADGERGDDTAANFLIPFEPGEEIPPPPTDPTCEPTDAQEPDCTTTSIGSYTAVKTVTPDETPVGVGTVLAYTLTFTNASEADAEVDETDTLTGVFDDATLVDGPTSSADSLVVSAITDGAFTIVGTLAPGETVTVVYTVSVNPESNRGDNLAANTLLPTDGDEECTQERCTETPLPTIVPSKSVSPTDGSTVTAGDVVTYTLTFENTSEVDGSIEFTDDLSGVLDDGTVTSQPTSSSPTGSATLDGDIITVVGSVPAGTTVTVVYEVTVLPDGQRGDDIMGNVLVPEGTVPEDECEEGDPLCTVTYVGELHDWKSVEASETPVAAGTELTYTLHVENRGEGTVDVNRIDFLTHVLDDADVTAEPVSDTLTVTRDGETITITGSLGAGESATVVYTVTVKADDERGDDTAANFLVPNDDPEVPPTPPTDPVCQPTDAEEPDCTTTPIGRLDTSKAVSASSDPIVAGTLLAYTLTFDNQSEADVEVDKIDDLSGVLDDATVTAEPVSSDAALTATRDGSTISITGTIAAGQTITVTYVVTVNDESERGDNIADNFLVNTGETVTECVEGDPNCTVTPLPNVDSSKSVDPASGSTVLPGDVLTYTLTLTNSGEAVGAVQRTDYLEGVLDDAAWTDGPTVSDPGVTAVLDGTELVLGGTLDPGQTVTVTYTVTVLPNAERGDDTLRNFLMEEPPGTDPECEEGECTENYVPRIVDSKSADPISGTPIAAGQEVTYTLTFRNDGTATGEVAKEDVLTDVLDDADLTAAPSSSSDALTVSDLTDGRILITGSLEPGESATVTYSVTVRPFSGQGDHVLGNWLVLPGETPPADCTVDMSTARATAASDPDCTVHPIGEIAATKSGDPRTGTAVTQGQVLRYSLTFTNTGTGTATVDYTDHLGDVFDDATLTSGPSSDVESVELELSGDTLTVGGSLAAGTTAIVTYSVTVMAYDRQGNHMLDNFLGLSGSDPEESCIADNPLCTSNPVTAPPPLAVTGGELGTGAMALMILLLLGGVLAIETSRQRRLLLESVGTRDEHGVS